MPGETHGRRHIKYMKGNWCESDVVDFRVTVWNKNLLLLVIKCLSSFCCCFYMKKGFESFFHLWLVVSDQSRMFLICRSDVVTHFGTVKLDEQSGLFSCGILHWVEASINGLWSGLDSVAWVNCFKGRLTERHKSTDPVSEENELIQSGRSESVTRTAQKCSKDERWKRICSVTGSSRRKSWFNCV